LIHAFHPSSWQWSSWLHCVTLSCPVATAGSPELKQVKRAAKRQARHTSRKTPKPPARKAGITRPGGREQAHTSAIKRTGLCGCGPGPDQGLAQLLQFQQQHTHTRFGWLLLRLAISSLSRPRARCPPAQRDCTLPVEETPCLFPCRDLRRPWRFAATVSRRVLQAKPSGESVKPWGDLGLLGP